MLTKEQYLLICAMEEAAEVTQCVSKALRFGMDEVQPGQTLTNRTRLELEIVDLVAVLEMLDIDGTISLQGYEGEYHEKTQKLEKYMQYARDQGTLEAVRSSVASA